MNRPALLSRKTIGLSAAVLATGLAVFSIAAQTDKPAATSQPTEWRDYAGSPEGNRYIDFRQITKANVDKLQIAWIYPYAETGNNALVADGVIYTHARNRSIVAVDAATGKEIWVHDGLTGLTTRGLNYCHCS